MYMFSAVPTLKKLSEELDPKLKYFKIRSWANQQNEPYCQGYAEGTTVRNNNIQKDETRICLRFLEWCLEDFIPRLSDSSSKENS